jgi:hypothetical protein
MDSDSDYSNYLQKANPFEKKKSKRRERSAIFDYRNMQST